MKAGIDFIGVGVGAMVFNEKGEVFLSQRGEKAKNERGTWEFPGGSVEFGEKLVDTVKREFMEEYGIEIEIQQLLSVDDHILPDEAQHWVSPTYIAKLVSGTATIREPDKCSAIAWFKLGNLPEPLSLITQYNVRDYLAKFGTNPPQWDE